MRKINKPNFSVEDILIKHKKHFTNMFNENYDLIKKNLIEKENYYEEKCENNHLASIPECKSSKLFDSNQMNNSYKYIYGSNSSYRIDIKNLAEGTCPLCDSIFGYRSLEFDHILPKSKFCDYIIIPINIVPICTSCNNTKQAKLGSVKEGILNPYFNKYNLKKMLKFKIDIINDDLKVEVNIINKQTFIDMFPDKHKDINNLNNSYNKIKHHILLHKINETIKNKAVVCLNSTIIYIIKNLQLYKFEEEKFFNILENTKSEDKQKLINEDYLVNILIDEIINHENRCEIYKIIISKTKQNLKEGNIDEDFDV